MGEERHDESRRPDRSPIAQIPMWKKMLVLCSVILMVAGGAMSAIGAIAGSDEAPPTSTTSGNSGTDIARGFAPSGGEGTGEAGEGTDATRDVAGDADWSPALFKLGFSFFVGFAVAFALRTFVKISIIAIGMFLLVHFALEYYGFIEVNWDVFGEKYDSIADWIGRQTGSFREFVTGSLPSAGSAAAGLVIGFRKG